MIRFSRVAEDDLRDIVEKITEDNGGAAARRVYGRISASILQLGRFPLMARAGRVANTRELIVGGLPFIVVYQVEPGGVLVLSVTHGAMRWPPSED